MSFFENNNQCKPCLQPTGPCPSACDPCPLITSTALSSTAQSITNTLITPNTTIPAIDIPILPGTIESVAFTNPIIFNNPIIIPPGLTFDAINGRFGVICAGRYLITASVCFAAAVLPPGIIAGTVIIDVDEDITTITTTLVPGDRALVLFRLDSNGNLIILASDVRPASLTAPTCITISTFANLEPGDSVFVGAFQNAFYTVTTTFTPVVGTPTTTIVATPITIITIPPSKFAITRLCETM